MNIGISSGAEAVVADGYWFYERQSIGLGDYFRSCIFADIESLRYFGGAHEIENGFHRSLSTLGLCVCFWSTIPGIEIPDARSRRTASDFWEPNALLAFVGSGEVTIVDSESDETNQVPQSV
jgi:hypothetical protein